MIHLKVKVTYGIIFQVLLLSLLGQFGDILIAWFFCNHFEQKIEFDGSSKLFGGFDDLGNLISHSALFEENITEKQEENTLTLKCENN